MKAAPVVEQLSACRDWDIRLIHTGQHYDEKLSDLFFRQLGMPEPAVNLGVGSGSHSVQTAKVMIALEEQFVANRPDLVVVFGDVNSTLAAALVASKLEITLAHVEAGLRSFDRSMPEEINRILTDAVADLLFVTEANARHNLLAEGRPDRQIFFVGNTMIDTLLKHREAARRLNMPGRLGLGAGQYVVVTLHRPSNVDSPVRLRLIADALVALAADARVVFPAHPRTAEALRRAGLWDALLSGRVQVLEPLGYLELIGLLESASAALTDSGGIQEETTVLGVPCVTLRKNTERPVTVTDGTNVLAGDDPVQAACAAMNVLRQPRAKRRLPEKWDGQAAQRIRRILEDWTDNRQNGS
jgi:UDP-N-acetylglucosamine 2-epimerase (non-hydrolysing)